MAATPLTVRQAYTVAAVAWLRALSNAEHIDFEEAPRIFVRASSQFLFDFRVSNSSELLLQATTRPVQAGHHGSQPPVKLGGDCFERPSLVFKQVQAVTELGRGRVQGVFN